MTLENMQKQVKEYTAKGFYMDVAEASRDAQLATRHYIARTHPQTAFDGKSLIIDYFQGKKHNQICIGKYEVKASVIDANIYANYFARWYNTGAFGRIIRGRGPRRGQRGPTYPPRGSYFESNRQAIEDFYAAELDKALQKRIDTKF